MKNIKLFHPKNYFTIDHFKYSKIDNKIKNLYNDMDNLSKYKIEEMKNEFMDNIDENINNDNKNIIENLDNHLIKRNRIKKLCRSKTLTLSKSMKSILKSKTTDFNNIIHYNNDIKISKIKRISGYKEKPKNPLSACKVSFVVDNNNLTNGFPKTQRTRDNSIKRKIIKHKYSIVCDKVVNNSKNKSKSSHVKETLYSHDTL